MNTVGAVMIEDTAARLVQGIEQAGERPRFRDAVSLAYHGISGRRALRKWRRSHERLQAMGWDDDLRDRDAADIAAQVRRFVPLWRDECRPLFLRDWRLRWVAPLIDSYLSESEDFEETLALASSKRFCSFVVRSVDAA